MRKILSSFSWFMDTHKRCRDKQKNVHKTRPYSCEQLESSEKLSLFCCGSVLKNSETILTLKSETAQKTYQATQESEDIIQHDSLTQENQILMNTDGNYQCIAISNEIYSEDKPEMKRNNNEICSNSSQICSRTSSIIRSRGGSYKKNSPESAPSLISHENNINLESNANSQADSEHIKRKILLPETTIPSDDIPKHVNEHEHPQHFKIFVGRHSSVTLSLITTPDTPSMPFISPNGSESSSSWSHNVPSRNRLFPPSDLPSSGPLRRVFSSHTRRKRKRPSFHLGNLLKEPLRVVHSVPLSFPQGSASSDLLSRRGVFSRRHYGSIEMLSQADAEGNETCGRRFRVESGELHGDRDEQVPFQMYGSPTTPILENPEYQTRWYFKYFLGKRAQLHLSQRAMGSFHSHRYHPSETDNQANGNMHQNYVGCSEKEPFLLSVVLSDANNQRVPQYRAILWRKMGAQKISLCYTPSKPMTIKQILSNFSNMDKIEKGPKEIYTPEIQKDLLLLEEQEGSVNFKFGILFMQPGQTSDDEILSNENGSRHFDSFLSLLGSKVRLKGWDKFRGGLDVKGDMTGKYSIYTIYEGHEVMFHVSTFLPFSKDNKQQVERKRHIGNDIVNIIFVEGTPDDMSSFSPSFIKSQFTHVFSVVSFNAEDSSYKLHIYSEENVPLFGPSLPSPPTFFNPQEFREFLLVKMINGEKATFNTPVFAQKRERTLHMLIKDIYQEHTNDGRGNMLNRRAFSDVLPDPPKSSRRKEEARQVEFVRFGQALKLDTIVRGDAPTSLATTGLFKRTPWEPQCCYPDFPAEVTCGDSWGESKLVLATHDGVFLVEEGLQHRLIFDKTVIVRQLSVVEAHGILLLRLDKGRDSKIHVFRLSDFEYEFGDSQEDKIRSKSDLKDHRLEKTKGCHLYAISRPGGSHLRMVVAVGKKLLILQWKHSAAWTAWCSASDSDTVEGFLFLREISLCETPSLLTLVDSPYSASAGGSSDNRICIGYKNHWDLANERTGESSRLYTIESAKSELVAAVDIYEDEEAEVLLCYNNTCHFQKLSSAVYSTEFDFHWNARPNAIVCAFPYILAFTYDSIEIRLVINGNLVQTMVMPNLSFLSSKSDIFFATTAPEFFNVRQDTVRSDRERDSSLSPPISPHSREFLERGFSSDKESSHSSGSSNINKPLRIYRIPFSSLTGVGSCERRCPTPSTAMNSQSLAGSNESDSPRDSPLSGILEAFEGEKCIKEDDKHGMHLQVKDIPYSTRSCSTSPTHGPTFPIPSPLANEFHARLPISPSKSPSRPRSRTHSLTVETSHPIRLLPRRPFTMRQQPTSK